VVASLAELWPAAGRMIGRPLDPLDRALLDRLQRPRQRPRHDERRTTGDHRALGLSRKWQDHASAPPSGRAGQGRHRHHQQRIRRDRPGGAASPSPGWLRIRTGARTWCGRSANCSTSSRRRAPPAAPDGNRDERDRGPRANTVHARHRSLKHHFAPAAVVVTLDPLNAMAQVERQPEARKQIITADIAVVTKANLAPREAVSRCRMRVRQLNPPQV
jgi:hypothetical protein